MMRIGIIDIGSNTARLLVATVDGMYVERLDEQRAYLGLGAAIERTGKVPQRKLVEAAALAADYAGRAASHDVEVLDVIVTAPGRQSRNGDELVQCLRSATGAGVRVLTCDEEGRYAYEGAAAMLDREPKVLAVCDIGGGSTEVVVGLHDLGPVFLRSFDIGSMRLTSRFFDGRPTTSRAEGRPRLRARPARRSRRACADSGARDGRHRGRASQDRRAQPRGRAPRGRDRRAELRGRPGASRPPTASSARGHERSSPARSSSPRCSGAWAYRSRSPAAACARAPHWRAPGLPKRPDQAPTAERVCAARRSRRAHRCR